MLICSVRLEFRSGPGELPSWCCSEWQEYLRMCNLSVGFGTDARDWTRGCRDVAFQTWGCGVFLFLLWSQKCVSPQSQPRAWASTSSLSGSPGLKAPVAYWVEQKRHALGCILLASFVRIAIFFLYPAFCYLFQSHCRLSEVLQLIVLLALVIFFLRSLLNTDIM